MYLIKNAFIVIIGLLISTLILYFYDYFNIIDISISSLLIPISDKLINNIIFVFIILFIIYYLLSLVNYLISFKIFTNYYCFVFSFMFSSIYIYILFKCDINISIETYLSFIYINLFASFFINYSCKYENNNI